MVVIAKLKVAQQGLICKRMLLKDINNVSLGLFCLWNIIEKEGYWIVWVGYKDNANSYVGYVSVRTMTWRKGAAVKSKQIVVFKCLYCIQNTYILILKLINCQ